MSQSNVILEEDRVLELERELRDSRAEEETSKTALQHLHRELKEAYYRIAQHQLKLEVLTRKLASRGGAETAGIATESAGAKGELLTDLANPRNLCSTLVRGLKLDGARVPLRHVSLPEGEAAERIYHLWTKLPEWTKGFISSMDARFLATMIDEVRPDKVYEVGVASGASSALILSTMAAYAAPAHVWLDSYDLSEMCYFDPAHAVGDATRAMVPDLLKNWKLNVKATAIDLPREREARALYFVDANHDHPWPALDLVALLPGLKPGDCVVLHDINLPNLLDGKFPSFGVQYLFDDWLGERLRPDVDAPNIGAVIIPEDKNLVLTSLVKTLSRPWPAPATVKDYHLHVCEQSLLEYLGGTKVADHPARHG